MGLIISIIVPSFNEDKVIGLCLSSITECMAGINYEVIVVDNGSSDSTKLISERFPNVKVCSIPRSTISFARNYGVERAQGKILAFVDADIVVTKSWADALVEILNDTNPPADFVGGYPYAVRDNPSLIERSWFSTILMAPHKYLSGGNIIATRNTFDSIGGFNEFLQTGEDVEFCERATQRGVSILFNPALEVIHLGYPASVSHFFRRESWHGIGDFQSLKLFASSKVAVAAVLFIILLFSATLLLITGVYKAALASIIMHFIMPMLFSLHKFRLKNSRYFHVQYFLSYVYLLARAFSLFRSVKERVAFVERA